MHADPKLIELTSHKRRMNGTARSSGIGPCCSMSASSPSRPVKGTASEPDKI